MMEQRCQMLRQMRLSKSDRDREVGVESLQRAFVWCEKCPQVCVGLIRSLKLYASWVLTSICSPLSPGEP